jgi:cation diffusion facilitator family transporter
MAGSRGEVVKSLVVNAVIAASKGVAAGITGSGAMLAETLHSFADCGNQLLLLVGIRQSSKPASPKHPLGYGRAMYFYSFIVAMLLFSGGGVFSIYEGVHKLKHPEAVGDITIALIILGISILLEGWSTYGNIKVLNEKRGDMPFLRYLRESKDSDLVVVFGENSAAVLGLALAGTALMIA